MKHCQHLTSWRHDLVDAVDHRAEQFGWKKVGRVPEQDDVEAAPGKTKVGCEKTVYIETPGSAIFLRDDPVALRGIFHQVGEVDAVAEGRDEVNVWRGGGSDVEDAQGFFAPHTFEQLTPAAGVPRDALAGRRAAAGFVFTAEKADR